MILKDEYLPFFTSAKFHIHVLNGIIVFDTSWQKFIGLNVSLSLSLSLESVRETKNMRVPRVNKNESLKNDK